MNAQHLAEAVVHWLEFETLCGRAELFSEAALRMPVGQYLMTAQDHMVIPEHSYPTVKTTRSKAIDYCLKRRAGTAIAHAIESKWVGDTPRSTLVDELYSDIYRLAALSWPGQTEPCDRWLLVAGIPKHLDTGLFRRELNADSRRVNAFGEILPQTLGKVFDHRVYTTTGKPRLPHAQKWKSAAEEISQTALMSGITGELRGLGQTSSYACYVWRLARPQGCGSKTLKDLFG